MKVRFDILLDWRRATAPPAIALRKLLKVLLRTFRARCLTCNIEQDEQR